MRVGPRRIVFIDYHMADQFPSPFPAFYQQLGIGSGFGSKGEFMLRTGGLIGSVDGAYLSTYVPLSKDFSIEPMVIYSGQSAGNFSIGLHYNLSQKTVYKKY